MYCIPARRCAALGRGGGKSRSGQTKEDKCFKSLDVVYILEKVRRLSRNHKNFSTLMMNSNDELS